MRKIVKEKATRFVFKMTCCKCGRKQSYIIGYDYPTLKKAKIHVPEAMWNGWYIRDNIELCPICLPLGIVFGDLDNKVARQGKTAAKNGKEIEDCPYHKDVIEKRSSWFRGFLIEKYAKKQVVTK